MEASNGKLQRAGGGCRCKIRVVGQKDGLWRHRKNAWFLERERGGRKKHEMQTVIWPYPAYSSIVSEYIFWTVISNDCMPGLNA